jgi:hypothetical protein
MPFEVETKGAPRRQRLEFMLQLVSESSILRLRLSNGIETGPPIGVEKGPPFGASLRAALIGP